MAELKLQRVTIDYPLYQGPARMARKALLRSVVGGAIGVSGDKGHVVVRALDGIDLEIRSGERLALLGHNGAGKTTLLRTMAGIYAPTSGRIAVTGRVLPLFDIGIGFDEEATGYENIRLRGLLMGLPRQEVERRIDDIASFSELGAYMDLPLRTYSSGMILRLLFSIATSFDADIVLMDEWIATGDQDFLLRADARLRGYLDRSRVFVLASHNLELLSGLCNRAVLLEGGRIVFDGPVAEALARYAEPQQA